MLLQDAGRGERWNNREAGARWASREKFSMCHMEELAFYPEEIGKGTEGLGTPEYHSEVAF